MSETVVKFAPVEVGENYRFDPDQILEEARGQGYTNVVIVGEMPDGTTSITSAANAGEAIILMERAKKKLIFGDD